jgi:diphthine-ammonia ligase
MNAVISWSGGKDSCLALYRALSQGMNVTHMLNFISNDATMTMSHCLDPTLIGAHAAALNLPLIQKQVNWDTYEKGFRDALKELKLQGIDTLINGDIDLPEGVAWNQKMCREIGIRLVMPLENADPERLLNEFIQAGFKAVIVCVDAGTPARDWLGVEIDIAFLARLYSEESGKVHFCGELGEFHTLVTDGPIFSDRIEVIESRPVDITGYSYLDISRYEIRAKSGKRSRIA